ncbi:hypothetical protein EUTSA_v10002752mg [Eutrema salsugineum]|uniref:Uncharacterized protein n=1 Tax=Eutrema salsugineum TaxID=72664 RepID=V4L3Q3_EUTSA|nr:hypothetical protein EUTSA_v10002752mg [Eutrema salsugineum]
MMAALSDPSPEDVSTVSFPPDEIALIKDPSSELEPLAVELDSGSDSHPSVAPVIAVATADPDPTIEKVKTMLWKVNLL